MSGRRELLASIVGATALAIILPVDQALAASDGGDLVLTRNGNWVTPMEARFLQHMETLTRRQQHVVVRLMVGLHDGLPRADLEARFRREMAGAA